MRTTFMAKGHEVERKWLVVDAEGQTLGRLASEVAAILRGKNKPTFTPNVDTGDHVIILNAEKIHLTGNKLNDKIYYRHTQFSGGLKQRTALEMRTKYPTRMLELAIKGMLPKNSLGRQMFSKLTCIRWSRTPTCSTKTRSIRASRIIIKRRTFTWHKFNISALVAVKVQ